MMIFRSLCCILVFSFLCMGWQDVGYSQDFLKQLEEKLRTKKDSEKPDEINKEKKEPPADELLPSPRSNDEKREDEKAEAPNPFLLFDEPSDSTTTPQSPRKPPTARSDDQNVQPRKTQPPKAQLPRSAMNESVRPPNTAVHSPPVLAGEERADSGSPGAPGYLGLIAERPTGGGVGLVVVEITQGSPAWKAGFQIGDRILGVNGSAVSNLDDLAGQLADKAPGEPIRFLVNRAGKSKDVVAVLQDRQIAARVQPGLTNLDPPYLPGNSPALLGLSVANLSESFRRQFGIPAYRGAAVTDVAKGSPAERAGIRPGDCVVEVDGEVIQNADAMLAWIANSVPGQHSSISYYRGRSLKQGQVLLTAPDGTIPGEIPLSLQDRSGASDAMRLQAGNLPSRDISVEVMQEIEILKSDLRAAHERIRELESRLRAIEPPSIDRE